MESASKVTENQRIKKPAPERVQNNVLDQEQPAVSRQPLSGRSIDDLPTGPGTRALRQAAVLQMQRTHGNAHVMRQLEPSIQRQELEAPAAAPSGPSAITGSGGTVDTGGGGVEITGGTVKVHSGYTEMDGVLKTNTIIADNVVGTNYTPGAGNIW